VDKYKFGNVTYLCSFRRIQINHTGFLFVANTRKYESINQSINQSKPIVGNFEIKIWIYEFVVKNQ